MDRINNINFHQGDLGAGHRRRRPRDRVGGQRRPVEVQRRVAPRRGAAGAVPADGRARAQRARVERRPAAPAPAAAPPAARQRARPARPARRPPRPRRDHRRGVRGEEGTTARAHVSDVPARASSRSCRRRARRCVALGVAPIACTRFCEQPGVPTVGGTKNPDVAAIVALAPDLVVVNDEENRWEDATALIDAGLAVHSMSPRSVHDVGAGGARARRARRRGGAGAVRRGRLGRVARVGARRRAGTTRSSRCGAGRGCRWRATRTARRCSTCSA